MIKEARYVHTNLVALDFRLLADFYQNVFGCVRVPPERDYGAADLERGTGLAGVGLKGVHLRLPGCGASGPTLEVFQYSQHPDAKAIEVNRPGFGHIAFAVESVGDARNQVLNAGGSAVGDVTTVETPDGRRVEWCYVRDPEGNVVELQTWE